MTVQIIVLALIALFVGLRLVSVLGRRTGHEQPIARPLERVPVPAPVSTPAAPSRADPVNPLDEALDPRAIDGVRAIVAADPGFDLGRFIEGAKSAYKMTLEAFWEGDEEELARLADDEVRSAFSHAIADRKAAGHRFELPGEFARHQDCVGSRRDFDQRAVEIEKQGHRPLGADRTERRRHSDDCGLTHRRDLSMLQCSSQRACVRAAHFALTNSRAIFAASARAPCLARSN